MKLALAALLALVPAASAGPDVDTGGASLTVYNHRGDSTVVANYYDGSSYAIRLTRYARNGSIIREDAHSDGYQEMARSVSLDEDGNAIIAGIRYWQGSKFLWAMKYSASGAIEWEWSDDVPGCSAAGLEVNHAGEPWVAANCSSGGAGSLRLARLTNRGYVNWARTFDNAGASRVQSLSVDAGSRAALTAGADGQVLTIVVDGAGRQLTSY